MQIPCDIAGHLRGFGKEVLAALDTVFAVRGMRRGRNHESRQRYGGFI